MEPTETSVAGCDPGAGPVQDLATTASRRHPARAAAAALSAIVVLAAGIGAVAATRNHGSRPPLVLTPGGRSPENGTPARAAADFAISPYHYRLVIPPPDLGSDAPVARLEAPAVDDSRIRSMAEALGLHGDVTRTAGGGRQVSDGSARLTVEPTPGGWAVSYGPDAADSSPGAVSGSAGSGSASSGSTGSGTVVGPTPRPLPPDGVAPPSSTVVPPIGAPPPTGPVDSTPVAPVVPVAPGKPTPGGPTPGSPVSPTSQPTAPRNVPGSAEAERVARALLGRMGVGDASWSATVADSSGVGVVCTPQPCATPEAVVTARTVVFHPVFNGAVIDGISWQVEIGDNSDILGVYGTWATLRSIDRYPLRSVAAVFADLVAGKGTSPGPQPLGAIDAAGAFPSYKIQPIEVAIDRVTLGYSVMPASDGGVAVVDVVPTYVFTGKATRGGDIVQELVAVEATVTTPDPRPVTPPTKPDPSDPTGSTVPPGPPIGKPEPAGGAEPADGATISGTPTT